MNPTKIEAGLQTSGNLNTRSFSFSISQYSIRQLHSRDREPDERFPFMLKGEVKILEQLLKSKRYCLNRDGKLAYMVLNRQGEITEGIVYRYRGQEFDYQRGVAPIIYQGKCL